MSDNEQNLKLIIFSAIKNNKLLGKRSRNKSVNVHDISKSMQFYHFTKFRIFLVLPAFPEIVPVVDLKHQNTSCTQNSLWLIATAQNLLQKTSKQAGAELCQA